MSPSIKHRLETQHQSVETIVSSISSKRILLRPAPEKWNIHDIVAHLVRYHQIFIERVQKTLDEEEPFFEPYLADNDGDFEYWRTNDMDHLLRQLNIDRTALYEIIINLTDEEQRRVAMHKKYGSHNIIQWIDFFLLHEAHHIFNIFKLAFDIELK